MKPYHRRTSTTTTHHGHGLEGGGEGLGHVALLLSMTGIVVVRGSHALARVLLCCTRSAAVQLRSELTRALLLRTLYSTRISRGRLIRRARSLPAGLPLTASDTQTVFVRTPREPARRVSGRSPLLLLPPPPSLHGPPPPRALHPFRTACRFGESSRVDKEPRCPPSPLSSRPPLPARPSW